MLKFKVLLTVSLAFCVAKAQAQDTIKGGSRVIYHTNNQGPKATYGNTVLITLNIWVNDSLVQSTSRDDGGPREIALPDSSQMKGKVPAVFEALMIMTKGDSATVIQLPDSTMKKGIPKSFGEVKEIRYEVKLEDILSPETLAARQIEQKQKAEATKTRGRMVAETVKVMLASYKTQRLKNVKKSPSGLEYVIIEQGSGAGLKDGESVPTSYLGVRKSDGVVFDNSFDRGGPMPITVGSLIQGFNEGMKLLNRGGIALLFIPSKLGFGDKDEGADMPPNTDLVLYIELEQ